ncbi:MAG TPA: T9SS type A sorting domain-containing protein [Bacteroidia bacterium]|nr:T9SS type A sorting domain-containing protein [Bacteroidia bacterium]
MGNTLRKLLLSIFIVTASQLLSVRQVVAVNATVMGALPSNLTECSGLDYTGGTHFWTQVDTYPDNTLYKISNSGAITRSVTVVGAVNANWEDLAHDYSRSYMFIGDFGNNNCDRTNLRIYRTAYPSTVSGSTVTAEAINFSYPDQNQFPSPWMNFDAEGFIHHNGHLFVFTKADGSAIGYTKMYMLPDVPGTYVATLVDSFYTNDRTTSADISADGSTLILISNTHIHLFRNFQGSDFFNGQHTQINISGTWTQKEAVTFWSNNEIYLTDEDNGNGNYLYYIDLSAWIPSTATAIAENNVTESIVAAPNPSNFSFTVSLNSVRSEGLQLRLFDLTGKMVRAESTTQPASSIRMETADLPNGVYFYKLIADRTELKTSRIVISH